MTLPASLPELPEMVSYTIACELGPGSSRGSEALASAVSALAAEVLSRSPRPDPAELRDFHGLGARRLLALGLNRRGESFQAELARVARAMSDSL